MKYLSTAILCLPFIAGAQITITDADFAVGDDTVIVSTSQDFMSVDPTPAGPNQTWDFSGINISGQRIDTLFAPSSLPFAYQIVYASPFEPDLQATYGRNDLNFDLGPLTGFVDVGNIMAFHKVESSGLKHVGMGANVLGQDIPMSADTIETIFNLPMNYGDEDSSTFYAFVDIPSAAYVEQYRKSEYNVEGWGTVITPFGSFDALKVKYVYTQTDSVYSSQISFGQAIPRPETTEYHWYANGQKIPVMKMVEIAGQVTSIEYRDSDKILSAPEVAPAELVVYPNPAQETVRVPLSSNARSIELTDLNGRKVQSWNVTPGTVQEVNVSDVSRGMYILSVIGKDARQQTRLIVQ